MTEPAIDLGICLAIVSSAKDIVIPDNVMVFGEVGLSGEIRAVNMAGQRVQEAKKNWDLEQLCFRKCVGLLLEKWKESTWFMCRRFVMRLVIL